MTEDKPTTAFIISLIAGVFIILGGGLMSMLGYGMMGMMGRDYGGFGGMMGPGFGMMGPGFGMMGFAFGMIGILGLIFGVIVIVSAIMLNGKPQEHATWGTLILIFSVLSLLGSAGGFGVGLILGIIGGVLAITWKSSEKK